MRQRIPLISTILATMAVGALFLLPRLIQTHAAEAIRPNGQVRTITPNRAAVPGTDAYEHAKLEKQIETLQQSVDTLRRELQRSDAATGAAVQSMRRPFCRTETVLKDPVANAEESCLPYRCDGIAGRCRETCRGSADCAQGYVCDPQVGNGRCVEV